MKKCKVTFFPQNKSVFVDKGVTLLEAVSKVHITINNLCGGDGICGRCKMIVKEGAIRGEISEKLTREEVKRVQVIGVNTAIASNSGTNSGVGFAIPVDIVKRVVPELIAQGRYRHPWLGITGTTLSPELVRAVDLPLETGVLVSEVMPDSPASKAGLRGGNEQVQVSGVPMLVGGDIVIAIDEIKIKGFDDVVNYLASHTSVGDVVTLTVVRESKELQVEVTLEERPSSG